MKYALRLVGDFPLLLSIDGFRKCWKISCALYLSAFIIFINVTFKDSFG